MHHRLDCISMQRATLDETSGHAAGRASFLCGLVAVAFEDLDRVPLDIGDIDGWLAWPDVQ